MISKKPFRFTSEFLTLVKNPTAAECEQFCSRVKKSVSDFEDFFLLRRKNGGRGSRGVPLRNALLGSVAAQKCY